MVVQIRLVMFANRAPDVVESFFLLSAALRPPKELRLPDAVFMKDGFHGSYVGTA